MRKRSTYMIADSDGKVFAGTLSTKPGDCWLSFPVHRDDAVKAGYRTVKVAVSVREKSL
jgi:hypothetical protein